MALLKEVKNPSHWLVLTHSCYTRLLCLPLHPASAEDCFSSVRHIILQRFLAVTLLITPEQRNVKYGCVFSAVHQQLHYEPEYVSCFCLQTCIIPVPPISSLLICRHVLFLSFYHLE